MLRWYVDIYEWFEVSVDADGGVGKSGSFSIERSVGSSWCEWGWGDKAVGGFEKEIGLVVIEKEDVYENSGWEYEWFNAVDNIVFDW